jgi:hypothetical protein
MRIC